jgi:hypothetical protein
MYPWFNQTGCLAVFALVVGAAPDRVSWTSHTLIFRQKVRCKSRTVASVLSLFIRCASRRATNLALEVLAAALRAPQSAASAKSSVAVISIAEAILSIETIPGF